MARRRIKNSSDMRYSAPRKVTVRFHSDGDSSFLDKVKEYARDKPWLQTTTEGYDHNGNSIVERRNGKVQQCHRALLLSATAGRLYYELSLIHI